jgi:hypothetical protein
MADTVKRVADFDAHRMKRDQDALRGISRDNARNQIKAGRILSPWRAHLANKDWRSFVEPTGFTLRDADNALNAFDLSKRKSFADLPVSPDGLNKLSHWKRHKSSLLTDHDMMTARDAVVEKLKSSPDDRIVSAIDVQSMVEMEEAEILATKPKPSITTTIDRQKIDQTTLDFRNLVVTLQGQCRAFADGNITKVDPRKILLSLPAKLRGEVMQSVADVVSAMPAVIKYMKAVKTK